MTILLVRVDDRLIHGQVVVGWTSALGANHILVADNEAAEDELQRTLWRMAAPANVKVTVLGVVSAAQALLRYAFGSDRLLLLVRGPHALLGLLQEGVKVERVNIGNVRSADGRVRLARGLHATPDELLAWRKLDLAGLTMEIQWLPGEETTNLNALLHQQQHRGEAHGTASDDPAP